MIEITKYKLEAVKESSRIYDFSNKKITSPKYLYEVIKDIFNIAALPEEVFGIVCLDTKNNINGVFEVSHGSIDSTVVHPREIFKRAISVNSAALILFHNHPSGETEPSREDKNITNRVIESGEILGIKVLDHIIACDNFFLSFKEQGYC